MDTVRGAISPISTPYNEIACAHVHEQKSPVKKKKEKETEILCTAHLFQEDVKKSRRTISRNTF